MDEEKKKRPKPKILVGKQTPIMDEKFRFTVPAQWRDVIGKEEYLIVLPSPVGAPCLEVYPDSAMDWLMEKIEKLDFADQEAADDLRNLGENMDAQSWDGQGRIKLIEGHVEFANLAAGNIVVSGKLRGFEIWSEKDWNARKKGDPKEQVSTSMRRLGKSRQG